MNKIPDNYRKLKPNETVKAGDLYHIANFPYNVEKLRRNVGAKVSEWAEYDFFRRKHTKIQVPTIQQQLNVCVNRKKNTVKVYTPTKRNVKPVADKTNPKLLVSFMYRSKSLGYNINRIVQVISLNDDYLIGLERIPKSDGDSNYKWQFKKFNVLKIDQIYGNYIKVVSYE